MRADGRRTKGLTAIEQAIPHIMPKRVDAQNYVTEYVDEEIIKDYIRTVRREKGVRLTRMAVIIAAYYMAALQHPYVNRFVVHSKIYDRNHFCVSFVMLKKRADGTPDETPVKVFMEPDDDIFTINQRINETIEKNSEPKHENSADKFAAFMLSVPVLPYLVMALVRLLDRLGLLPRSIVDLSPFHTSMFITNLASIKTSYIHHHCYEFGTTSVFVCMGKPVPDYMGGDLTRKVMPIGVVMDERICTGYEYAAFYSDFKGYLRDLSQLETPFDGSRPQKEEEKIPVGVS